jgi:hypothetical protein
VNLAPLDVNYGMAPALIIVDELEFLVRCLMENGIQMDKIR